VVVEKAAALGQVADKWEALPSTVLEKAAADKEEPLLSRLFAADKAEPLPRQQKTKKKPQEVKLLPRKVVIRNVRTRHAAAWTRLIRDLFTTCGTSALDA